MTISTTEADGAGGISGPPSASATGANTQQSMSVAISLFIGLPPFLRLDELDIIPANALDAQSLFAHFRTLRCAGRTHDALAVCDLILEIIRHADFDSHLRLSNARAIALRDLYDFRGAYRAHMTAKPFLIDAAPTLAGDHYHGLAMTLTELGEHDRAKRCFERACDFHTIAGDDVKIAYTDLNTARLLIRMDKPAEAHPLIDAACETWEGLGLDYLCAEADTARALAYEAEGDLERAFEVSARSVSTLIGTEYKLARGESLATHLRIAEKVSAK